MKDNVTCMNCGYDRPVELGVEKCPSCGFEGYLAWKEGEPQEIESED